MKQQLLDQKLQNETDELAKNESKILSEQQQKMIEQKSKAEAVLKANQELCELRQKPGRNREAEIDYFPFTHGDLIEN